MNIYTSPALFLDMTIAVCLAMVVSRMFGKFSDPS
jgi:hypothetical protein